MRMVLCRSRAICSSNAARLRNNAALLNVAALHVAALHPMHLHPMQLGGANSGKCSTAIRPACPVNRVQPDNVARSVRHLSNAACADRAPAALWSSSADLEPGRPGQVDSVRASAGQ